MARAKSAGAKNLFAGMSKVSASEKAPEAEKKPVQQPIPAKKVEKTEEKPIEASKPAENVEIPKRRIAVSEKMGRPSLEEGKKMITRSYTMNDDEWNEMLAIVTVLRDSGVTDEFNHPLGPAGYIRECIRKRNEEIKEKNGKAFIERYEAVLKGKTQKPTFSM